MTRLLRKERRALWAAIPRDQRPTWAEFSRVIASTR